MEEYLVVGLTSIILLGGISQWIAWKIRLPVILVLLIFGFIAGPITGLLNPEKLFGEFFHPLISLSVAVILFEGGLSLRYRELKDAASVVRNLVSIGIIVTWMVGLAGAYFILHLDFNISLLFSAILVVSGPTVIIPLVKHLKLSSRIGSVAKWEGIVNDPIGALLAVLIFGGILTGNIMEASAFIAFELAKSVIFGSLIGFIGALIVILFIKKYWIPYSLHNPMVLMLVVVAYTSSRLIQSGSGLIAVTIMGIILANQRYVVLKHIMEFKEILSVLLVSSLFIILSASLQMSDISVFNVNSLLFILLMILIARPIAVILSTIGSSLNWRERVFLFWMAPRGIVAAAVASVFAIRLGAAGNTQAHLLMPLTFFVIIGTVIFYGSTAAPVARLLKIAEPNPQGILVVGAHPIARKILKCLLDKGFKVLAVDTNRENVVDAHMENIPAYYGNILSENIFDEIDVGGIGRLFALTSNDEVNNLAAMHFLGIFDQKELYHLPCNLVKSSAKGATSPHLRGRILFGEYVNYDYLNFRFNIGAEIKCTRLTEKFGYEDLKKHYGESAVPLFLITETNELLIFTTDNSPVPKENQILVSIVSEEKA